MNQKKTLGLLILATATLIVVNGVVEIRKTREQGRAARQQILDDMGMDVVAIHRATDIINGQIERGEIRDWDTLRQRVTDEVAIQKIQIHEFEA